MNNKKLFISLLTCIFIFSSIFTTVISVKAESEELTVSTLNGEMVEEDDIDDNKICIVDIDDEDTPLAVGDSGTAKNLNSDQLDEIQDNLINSINDTRKSKAKNKTVSELVTLEKTGNVRAAEIKKRWSHTRPNGQSWVTVLTKYGISKKNLKAGENLAKISLTARTQYSESQITQLSNVIHESLMNSPTHRKVILNQNYSRVGIGIYSEVKNGRLTIYVTEHFKNADKKQSSAQKVSISKTTVKEVPTTQAYTGKQIKPSITVKYSGKTLKKGTDYTVSYGANKSTGKATVKITGKGNYTGSVTKTFYIVPKKVTLSTFKTTTNKLTVNYKKVTGASGYQIAYQKSGSQTWTYTTVSSKSASKTLTKLTNKKNYKVKVRAYKTVSGKKYYGAYSTIKTITMK